MKLRAVPRNRKRRVDRVARRARLGRDDVALFAEEPVDERRLAHVGPADDRDVDALLALRADRCAGSAPPARRARRRCPSLPTPRRHAARRSPARRTRSARCSARGRRACSRRAAPVAPRSAAARRSRDRPGSRLPSRRRGRESRSDSASANSTCRRIARSIESVGVGHQPTRVDEPERAPAPFRVAEVAVARRAGHLGDDGAAGRPRCG